MRVLVTGGAGFIGSNFVRRSIQTRHGIAITVLDSLTYAGSLQNLEGVLCKIKFVHGDITNRELVDQLVSDSDLVVHFAAESHNDNSLIDARPFLDSNVGGTFELVQACVKYDVRFHHISTDEVFGDLALDSKERFTEESPYNPSSPYSATKAASDMLVKAWIRSFGLRATISNCSNNYGPFQHAEKLIPRTVLLATRGVRPKLYGAGLNVRDWIHVYDHVDGVWAVIDRGRLGETYLLGANSERTNIQVVREILKELGLSEDFLDFTQDRPGHDLRYSIDPSKAEQELGWKPKISSFEESLKPVVKHCLKRIGLKN
jgi:dTDP-glucose 4,6-dehydratase